MVCPASNFPSFLSKLFRGFYSSFSANFPPTLHRHRLRLLTAIPFFSSFLYPSSYCPSLRCLSRPGPIHLWHFLRLVLFTSSFSFLCFHFNHSYLSFSSLFAFFHHRLFISFLLQFVHLHSPMQCAFFSNSVALNPSKLPSPLSSLSPSITPLFPPFYPSSRPILC